MKYLAAILFLMLVFGCQKPITTISTVKCDALKQAIASKDVAMVQQELNNLLEQNYSEANLDKIASDISNNCGDVTAKLQCFDCIKTNPPQSAITVAFAVGDPVRQFVLNLAPGANNTIKVVSIN